MGIKKVETDEYGWVNDCSEFLGTDMILDRCSIVKQDDEFFYLQDLLFNREREIMLVLKKDYTNNFLIIGSIVKIKIIDCKLIHNIHQPLVCFTVLL